MSTCAEHSLNTGNEKARNMRAFLIRLGRPE
jgi:hypothetical protein